MRGRGLLGALAALVGLGLAGLPSASAGPAPERPAPVSAYFFGDSLMAGTGAAPRRPVMAHLAAARLGWDVEVDAWGGTGYSTSGAKPGYLDRLRRPGALAGRYDVVLLEGGTNDARGAEDPARLRRSVEAVVEEVRRRQPRAQIVLMGPYEPPAGGRTDARRRTVDAVVADVARTQGLPYFSPLSGGWSERQAPSFLHADGLHPTDRGYRVMGARLTRELAALGLRDTV